MSEKQVFPCREKECDQMVVYIDDQDIAHFNERTGMAPTQPERKKQKIVYLTCGNGHLFPYEVVIPD